jgi:two-component system OmpR family response regulator
MSGNQSTRILIVEDEEPIAGFIRQGLMEAGFVVDIAGDGLHGFELAKSEPYNVLILDIMLPGIDGLELLRRVRAAGMNTHVLILSAKGSVSDRVTGLQLGADDYLTKPFAFAELLARIQSLLRRDRGAQEPLSLVVSDLILDLLNHKAIRGGEEIDLQPQEYSLLKYLMVNRGRVVTRTQILQHVWGYNFHPSTNLVEVHVCRLREKIERPDKPRLLRTIRGAGYMLADDVQVSE